jgi:AcrR family transcriptional regulator
MTAVITILVIMTSDIVRSPRQRIVYAAAQSVRERGVSATALRDVVEQAQAPRGSLQHYFPGGKDQLVTEAIAFSADIAARAVTRYIERSAPVTPGALFAAMANGWRDEFTAHGFARGCPLLAAAADVAGPDAQLRATINAAFDTWATPVRAALRGMGVPAARARSLATLMISALEGAIVLARTCQDTAPLRDVVRELTPLLDASAPQAGGSA